MALEGDSSSDIHVGAGAARLSGVPGGSDPVAAPDGDAEELSESRTACQEYREQE
jgi:hypothetical protein